MTQDTSMNINEILDHLPHRYPFVLVDKVLSYEVGKKIEAVKNVTINEPFFPGHFPHYPVMPGILIIEAMAQAAAILSFKTMNDKPNDHSVYYFAGVDNARFKKPVVPGDQLKLKATVITNRRGIYKFSAEASVDDELVGTMTILCAERKVDVE